MKLAIDLNKAQDVKALQSIYQVTVISDKGLVFMHRDDWNRMCDMLCKCTDILYEHKTDNELANNFCLWNECFMVAYDASEDYSCHAICNFELFSLCCKRCDINCVLLPMYDIISYVNLLNAHNNNEALGHYNYDKTTLIEVEDN